MIQSPAGAFFAAFQRWTYLQCHSCCRAANFQRLHLFKRSLKLQHNRQFATTRSRSAASASSNDDEIFNQALGDTAQPRPNSPPISYIRPYVFENLEAVLNADPQKRTSEELRGFMREMPHSVVVVTACCEKDGAPDEFQSSQSLGSKGGLPPTLSPYYEDFCGVTISSMTTVTLGPPAIISFNLKLPSRTLSGILQHKELRIHLLRASPTGAEIANAFIAQKHADAFKTLAEQGRWIGLTEPNQRKSMAPKISGSGIRTSFKCHIIPDKCVEVGDHMVVIAQLDSASNGVGKSYPCLLYSDQQYKRHGETLSLPVKLDTSQVTRAPSTNGVHDDVAPSAESSHDDSVDPLLYSKVENWYNTTLKHLHHRFPYITKKLANDTSHLPQPNRTYVRAIVLDEIMSRYQNLSLTELALLPGRWNEQALKRPKRSNEEVLTFGIPSEAQKEALIERDKLYHRFTVYHTQDIEDRAKRLWAFAEQVEAKGKAKEHMWKHTEIDRLSAAREMMKVRPRKVFPDSRPEEECKDEEGQQRQADGEPKTGDKPLQRDEKMPWWYI